MSSDPEVLLLLGKIDGKLDQVIETAEEHREDDKRRFGDVFKRLDDQDATINQAKGAKSALLWVAGGIATVSGAVAAYAAKALGLH